MVNCATFSPIAGGVIPGIELAVGLPTARNDGSIQPPHVPVGERFVALHRNKPPAFSDGLLKEACVLPIHVGRTFSVLACAEGTKPVLVLVDLDKKPAGIKVVRRKVDPLFVKAVVWFEGDIEFLEVDERAGKAMVSFTKDEQYLLVFDRDGAVHRLVRRGDEVIVDRLTSVEMARERIILLRSSLRDCSHLQDTEQAVRRKHGILGGCVRMTHVARDPEARGLFRDFLTDFAAAGEMPNGMRREVCGIFRRDGDLRHVMFEEGASSNVIQLDSHRESVGHGKKKTRKNLERAERDRAYRESRKSKAGGDGKKNLTDPTSKVARRRARKEAQRNRA